MLLPQASVRGLVRADRGLPHFRDVSAWVTAKGTLIARAYCETRVLALGYEGADSNWSIGRLWLSVSLLRAGCRLYVGMAL